MSKNDYHQILGISFGASVSEIKYAFRKRAHRLHPDHGGDAKKFTELQDAFQEALLHAKLSSFQSISRENIASPDAYSAPSGFNAKFYPSFMNNSTVDEIFADKDYNRRRFFQPSHPNVEGLERAERAREKHCRICDGTGRVSKVMDPKVGFMSLETRLCSCQKLEPEELAL